MRIGATIGTNVHGVMSPQDVRAFIDLAEDSDLDSLWMGDHVNWKFPVLEALTLLSTYAARTERIDLGTGILQVPLRPPVLLAKMLATIAYLAGGRLRVGVAPGGYPPEFAAAAVPLTERGSRLDESITIMRRLWSEPAVDFTGRHFRLEQVSIDPKPPATIPIIVGGASEAAYRRAARVGDGFLAAHTNPAEFAATRAKIEAYGVGPDFEWVFAGMWVNVGADRAAARRTLHDYIHRTYNNVDWGDRIDSFTASGPADVVIEKLLEYRAAGCTHILLNPACVPEEKVNQLRMLIDEVLPAVRSVPAA